MAIRSRKSRRPVETITERGQSIPIYRTPDVKDGKVYDSFTIAYFEAGKRVRRRASSLADARVLAKKMAVQLSEGVGHFQALSPQQVADYLGAVKLLQGRPELNLTRVVAEFLRAADSLGSLDVAAACADHRERTVEATGIVPASVEDVFKKFLAALEADNASGRYIEDCRSRMGRLKDAFRCQIHNVSVEDLRTWLEGLKVGVRTRKNFRTAAVALFKFAKERGHLPRNMLTAAEQLPTTKRLKAVKKDAEIGFYSREDFRRMLRGAPSHLVPVLAIGGLAGLRSAEICRLKWGDIRRQEIIVQAENAKTGSRRVVPIVPALACWLETIDRGEPDERVCANYSKESALARAVTQALKDSGVTPVHNGLRHSFCTYRLADIQNAPKVALEAGNSPAMLFRHYRALATAEEGLEWFSIVPAGMENVVSFEREAAQQKSEERGGKGRSGRQAKAG
jgi:integrase